MQVEDVQMKGVQMKDMQTGDRQSERQSNDWLNDYAANHYSQFGEDGILAKILERLPEHDQWCVEFGAWDGKFLSNTAKLIEQNQYSAVLIEGDPERFGDLEAFADIHKQVVPLCAMVGFSADDGLDHLLRDTAIPQNFDVLSIDIDGNDYHVWDAVNDYRPKVVCIEFNPSIPNEVRFVQEANPNVVQGSSAKAMVELGQSKGYELVATTTCNAIFVEAQYFPLFGIADNSLVALRKDFVGITYLFVGYDGTVFLEGNRTLLWSPVAITERSVQQVPKYLRGYNNPDRRGFFKRLLYRLYLRWHHRGGQARHDRQGHRIK